MPAVKVSRRTAGEGSGHTARAHVCEESHSGIVPMNHSNKDGTSLAESEEGRLLIQENAGQPDTCPTQKDLLRAALFRVAGEDIAPPLGMKRQVWTLCHSRRWYSTI
jgi:hypothetical protein